MKKTSTFDSFINQFAEQEDDDFSDCTPSDELIQNILNYSKVSVCRKSQSTGIVNFILN